MLIVVVLELTIAPAFAAQASEETIAVFRAAIEAVKAIEHPLTGKGTAISEMYSRNPKIGSSEKIVDFIFKDDLSRSTSFSMKEGKREKPELLWAVGEQCAVTYNYNQGHVAVQRNPQLRFYRQLGYDFNPDTFIKFHSPPLAVQLERILNGPATLSTKMDNEGILHLIAEYKDQNKYESQVISIDPAKDYRLIKSLCIWERFDQPARNHTDFLEIKWDKYESSWYAKAAKWASYAGVHSPEDISSLGVENIIRSITVTVTEFYPNVEVSDSEFTLNGLELPDRTLVIDMIAGVKYRIGSALLTEDILKKPLSKAEFPKSTKSQVDTKDVKQDITAIHEQTKSEMEESISNEESTQEILEDTLNNDHKQRNVLMIVALFVGIIVVLVICLKLLLVSKFK